MKLGHFGALCCFAVALLGAGGVYWDLQDGYFSTKLLALPILAGVLGLALLLFPGGPTTLREAARPTSAHTFAEWQQATPRLHRRAWLVALGLGIYLSSWAQSYLRGQSFFALDQQLTWLLAYVIIGFFLRKQLRQMW